MAVGPKDPFIESLAGRIGHRSNDYPSALRDHQATLAIWPDMIEAHETLSGTYQGLGENDKAVDELRNAVRIKEQNLTADQSLAFSIMGMLFSVGCRSGSSSARF